MVLLVYNYIKSEVLNYSSISTALLPTKEFTVYHFCVWPYMFLFVIQIT